MSNLSNLELIKTDSPQPSKCCFGASSNDDTKSMEIAIPTMKLRKSIDVLQR